jgi:hypothetical protein
MSGYYVESTENGNDRTVFTFESRCGDFPECHDEDNPCACEKVQD